MPLMVMIGCISIAVKMYNRLMRCACRKFDAEVGICQKEARV